MAVFCVKMFERLLYGLLLLNLALRQTTGVFDSCRPTETKPRVELPSTRPPQCTTLESLCHSVQDAEYLVGTEVSYECPVSGTITFTKQTGSDTSGTQITNGGRFSISGQTLTITNIQPEDEGLYRCSKDNDVHNLGCLAVSGLARFKTCESNFTFEYTRVPTTENSCSQNVIVTEGEDAEFDTRLLFDRGGDCQCIEGVTLLRVREDSANGNLRFFCDERIENCNDKEGFVVRGASELPYDFSLVLKSVNTSNSGRYYVEVEVMEPRVSSTRRFWKIINVTVNTRSDTVSPTNEEPPTTQTTDNAGTSMPTHTTINQTLGVGELDPSPQTTPVAGIAVGVAVAVVVVIAAIIVVVVVVISRRPGSRDVEDTHQRDKAGTGEEVVYATIEETGQRQTHPVGSKNRPDSTYETSGNHHHLHPKLESETIVL